MTRPSRGGVYHRVTEHGTSPLMPGDHLIQEQLIALQRGHIKGQRVGGNASHWDQKIEKH
ncbi:MAG: hypothetical protein JWR14_1416 [Caballeronia sp.]|jgi:hypothetical protein|nr:hypothetical protein [Caballeronia sp.]